MCWNSEVSLNTFIFSMFVLLVIMYNNAYTKYKIEELNHFWIYAFFISFILMQLIEYFIWKNIKSPYYNNIFSICATILLLIQPIITIMLINNETIKKYMLVLYLVLSIPFSIYRFSIKSIKSNVTKKGHLHWDFLLYDNENIYFLIWVFFFLFSFFYNQTYLGFFFGLIMLIITLYNYFNDKSIGSMWCWIVNSIMIYYAAYLLIYLPFILK